MARAESDVQLAERALEVPPALGTGAYQAQQATDTVLKMVVAAYDEAFSLTTTC